MKRRAWLILPAVAAMIVVAALQQKPKEQPLLLLEWSKKAAKEETPVAVLIEMGLNDKEVGSWSGEADVSGARVVHREGYRFREGDKLTDPNGWEASSHKPLRAPPRNQPAVQELFAPVGVVLHLKDIGQDAKITLTSKEKGRDKVTVTLKEILSGKNTLIWDSSTSVRLVSTATPLVSTPTEDDFPAAAYGPDGAIWLASISYTVRDESRKIEQKQFKEQPKDFKALLKPDFADQLFVQYYHNGSWSKPTAVTDDRQDLVRCAIGAEGDGNVWVAYSANRGGNYDIYVRSLNRNTPEAIKNPAPRVEAEQRLTKSPSPDLGPVMATDQNGVLWLACQSWDESGTARIALFKCKDGKWSDGPTLPNRKKGENCWNPSISAGPAGNIAVGYDVYIDGDYDVHVAVVTGEKVVDRAVASSPKFESRPSLAYDAKGRLWIAYEEGEERWGKDFGPFDDKDGSPLYRARSARVVCLEDGKWLKPGAELPTSTGPQGNPDEKTKRYTGPKLGLDGKGRVWLTYRQKYGSRYTSHPGSYWLTHARRLDGDKWTDPVDIAHSDGLLDHRPVLLPHVGGGLLVFHNTDGRISSPDAVDNQIYSSILGLPGDPAEPKLTAHEPGTKDGKRFAEEQANVERIREYRAEVGGKKYQLLRGEFHRHTEVSWDGGPDGSLEDMFRYAIDGARMDWIGNADHDNGGGREYTWWLTQKLSDAYHVAKVFTPMFTYERSVPYPHGHRNCMFAKRGVLTLPRLAENNKDKAVAGVHADDALMLYRYLKEMDGICASHTSATGMGTNWRDNDPEVEPIVEIYQGDRMSYEYEGCPRSGYDPQGEKKPIQIGGWKPDGFVNLAFKKGYKFGFQASSDHFSTHISYCIAIAEKHDREGILSALKKRHCYGATDDIILDVRSGTHMMGDEFKTAEAPTLTYKVVGTKEIASISILKDSEVVDTIKPGKNKAEGTWTDPKPTSGKHYYYVRVQQVDDELAWGSPMWIECQKGSRE